ncbi:MAG: hypothetical protein JNL74_00245 [Fibrobacteres bacterium]|nr:hypothetical protein [Fibrobacterota bacterium]
METKIFKLSHSSKVSIFVPIETESKNALPIGQILQLNGYNNPRYVITANEGISERFPAHGTRYKYINLSTFAMSVTDACALEFLSDKRDNRIQTYIVEGEIMPAAELQEVIEIATKKKEADARRAQKIEEENNRLIMEGKALFEKYQLSRFPAFIVAEYRVDECDTMTDYFNSSVSKTVFLAASNHKRHLFSEMRKAAELFEETKHLGRNCTGEIEHRENYSMGGGFYLKNGYRHSTGWTVRKYVPWSIGPELYKSLAQNSDILIANL